ncbi:MAG: DegV family EDD domain-containing protein [Bacilli bacterium]|nr:DegV family EDD domain-containing protein [Bacilli bacterium]
MSKFQIFTDSACDLDHDQRESAHIEYFRMGFTKNEKPYDADLDYQLYSVEEFYKWVEDTENNKMKTSLVTKPELIKRMTPFLDKGEDILYIGCTTALTGTLNLFNIVKAELEKQYPERRIIGVDSKRAGLALGLLCLDSAKMRDEGKSIDEIIAYIQSDCLKYNLVGTLSTLKYLKAAGRVSGASAFFGDLFGVKPIIVSDEVGNNYVTEKVKGLHKALDRLVEVVKELYIEGETIYLGQGMSESSISYLRKRFEEELKAQVLDYWIGPIIGMSCGPGVVHIVFRGKVAKVEKNK